MYRCELNRNLVWKVVIIYNKMSVDYDKGNRVVVLNSEDYYSKLDHIFDDPTKFIKVNTDGKVHPIISKENSINYHINKYLKSYDNSITSKIVSTGSAPGKA